MHGNDPAGVILAHVSLATSSCVRHIAPHEANTRQNDVEVIETRQTHQQNLGHQCVSLYVCVTRLQDRSVLW